MASLFSKTAIKQAISAYDGLVIDREITIVQELLADFHNGNMKDETRYEQNFNELFFHQLLGYEPKTNLHPKASTPVGSKIADVGLGFYDGGLYHYEGTKVVVELKGSVTLLDKKQASYGGQSPVDQGFGYKTSFKDCPWLIVSNFASIRLYRDNKQDFEIWTIEDLANPDRDYYHLKTLLGLLKRNRLISQTGTSFTEQLLSEVRIKQEHITKEFYKQYKALRFELIHDIRYHNNGVDVEVVVEKAQKIIDRIIFIHFCEDRGLLPEGKLKTNVLRAREADFSPWDVLKRYFKGVDSGSEKLEIPHGYNGGLFHDDPVLNALEIGDAICHKFIDLGVYDFDDELSVNILGHIFEQSISDIEQLKGELVAEQIPPTPFVKGETLVEKKESKRKKDGIFYTPEYIVDYIVQNSLMKYLEEKEIECLSKIGKKGGYKTETEAYQAYQHILQHIKVLDPACGSGAFLVRVFDYLYAENKRVGQIVNSLFDDDEIYKSILRNNIYGVDLNPESVEITKLSLWLKSAQKGKKLNNLDDNIKYGNSLIDDPAVAGDRAFDRNKEFSDILTQETSIPVMLTFATKYSRIPSEEYSKKRYNAVMETGKEAVILQPEGVQLIRGAIREQIEKMGCILLNMAILPDHVHVTLVPLGHDISEIANKLKGYSSYVYNRALQGTETEQGQQNMLRTKGYSATILDDEKHLHNALHYVDHNHLKHSERRGEDLLSKFHDPSDQRGTQAVPYEKFTYTAGGFDVIVGNPPYVSYYSKQSQSDNQTKKILNYLVENYNFIKDKSKLGRFNTVMFFLEKGVNLMKKDGHIGYIIDTNIHSNPFEDSRKFLLDNISIYKIIDEISVFEGVGSSQLIFCGTKNKIPNNAIIREKLNAMNNENLGSNLQENISKLNFINNDNDGIYKKITNHKIIADLIGKEHVRTCITFTGKKDYFVHKNNNGKFYPLLEGSNGVSGNYCITQNTNFIDYNLELRDKLNQEYLELAKRDNKRSPMVIGLGNFDQFMSPKLFIRLSDKKLTATFSDKKECADLSLYIITLNNLQLRNDKFDLKYILSIVNSNLMSFYFISKGFIKNLNTGTPQIRLNEIRNITIPEIPLSEQQPFIVKADLMLSLNKELHDKTESFLRYISSKYGLVKLSTKLQKFYEYDFAVFLTEMGKEMKRGGGSSSSSSLGLKAKVVAKVVDQTISQVVLQQVVPQDGSNGNNLGNGSNLGLKAKVVSQAVNVNATAPKKLSMSEEAELMEFFDNKKSEIVELKNKIDATDREIDEMVFELYGLTEEEREVVMGG